MGENQIEREAPRRSGYRAIFIPKRMASQGERVSRAQITYFVRRRGGAGRLGGLQK